MPASSRGARTTSKASAPSSRLHGAQAGPAPPRLRGPAALLAGRRARSRRWARSWPAASTMSWSTSTRTPTWSRPTSCGPSRSTDCPRHGGGRRRPGHLLVPGRHRPQHPRLPRPLPRRHHGHPRAELPVDRPHPRPGQRGDRRGRGGHAESSCGPTNRAGSVRCWPPAPTSRPRPRPCARPSSSTTSRAWRCGAGRAVPDRRTTAICSRWSWPAPGIPFVKYGGLRFLEAAHVRDLVAACGSSTIRGTSWRGCGCCRSPTGSDRARPTGSSTSLGVRTPDRGGENPLVAFCSESGGSRSAHRSEADLRRPRFRARDCRGPGFPRCAGGGPAPRSGADGPTPLRPSRAPAGRSRRPGPSGVGVAQREGVRRRPHPRSPRFDRGSGRNADPGRRLAHPVDGALGQRRGVGGGSCDPRRRRGLSLRHGYRGHRGRGRGTAAVLCGPDPGTKAPAHLRPVALSPRGARPGGPTGTATPSGPGSSRPTSMGSWTTGPFAVPLTSMCRWQRSRSPLWSTPNSAASGSWPLVEARIRR